MSDFGQTQFSGSTDPYNKSFDDDRRNLLEGIKSILLSKVEAIHKAIAGVKLTNEIQRIKEWRTDTLP